MVVFAKRKCLWLTAPKEHSNAASNPLGDDEGGQGPRDRNFATMSAEVRIHRALQPFVVDPQVIDLEPISPCRPRDNHPSSYEYDDLEFLSPPFKNEGLDLRG